MSHRDGCAADCGLTPTREELRRNHGTPEEFTDAIINAIGEISVAEAQQAIALYRATWARAGICASPETSHAATGGQLTGEPR